MKRSFTIFAAASGTACVALVLALLVSYRLDVRRHGLALSPRFHVGIFEGSFWFYSHQWPYRGSILWNDKASFDATQKSHLDFPGVYYRFFRFPAEPQSLWTLRVSMIYLIFMSSIAPLVWLLRRRRQLPLNTALEPPAVGFCTVLEK